MIEVMLFLLALLFGSLPFSVWLGRIVLRGEDVRKFGDGNPGATNAWRAGGWLLGMLVLVLDITKGSLPVGLAYQVFHIDGVAMWCIALAPTLGHAFSPFLKGRGGKAIAVTLGVWIGLSIYTIALPMTLFLLLWYAVLRVDGWAVFMTLASSLLFLVLFFPDPLYLAVLSGDILILLFKHREDLAKPLIVRSRVRKLKKKQNNQTV
jgi:glycerol-3-phosphate acyltransferase PlsY